MDILVIVNDIDEGVEVVVNFFEMVYSEVGMNEEIMNEFIVESVVIGEILLVIEVEIKEGLEVCL